MGCWVGCDIDDCLSWLAAVMFAMALIEAAWTCGLDGGFIVRSFRAVKLGVLVARRGRWVDRGLCLEESLLRWLLHWKKMCNSDIRV